MVCLSLIGPVQAEMSTQNSLLLGETDLLLEAVKNSIVADLKRKEMEVEDGSRQSVQRSTGDGLSEAQLLDEKAAIESERKALLRQVTEWSRSDADDIGRLSTAALNKALASARSIAEYYGLDVEKLGRLYELGKSTIRNSEFAVPDRLPPDKNESYVRYFQTLFVFAHEREKELAEFQAKTQEYRVGLFKRVTLAYLRALLSAGEPFPPCDIAQRPAVGTGQGKRPSLGCKDPVVENLRAYVKAVLEIASAESDTFAAEAENLIAEQTLIGDMASAIPLVSSAIDFYSLATGEDLAGNCLSRFAYGVTAFFSLLEFVPSSWVEQLVKRAPGLEQRLARLFLWVDDAAGWSATMLQGFAARLGIPSATMQKAMQLLTSEIRLTRSGLELQPGATWKVTTPSRTKLSQKLSAEEIVLKNLKMAQEGQLAMRSLPDEVRHQLEQTSRRIMEANLDAVQGSRQRIIEISNIVPEHLLEFEKLAKEKNAIVIFRAVNSDATDLIKANYGTKWMDVKPKSADWGPHRGFLPYDQNFSKIGNPEKLAKMSKQELAEAASKVKKFSDYAEECLAKTNCFKTPLVLPDGNSVHIWKRADEEIPVLRNSLGQYLDPETREILAIGEGTTRPMEVMAGLNAKGELVPLTADYDLLAVGTPSDVGTPKFSEATGYISEEEELMVGEINKAAKNTGYTGGNVCHHGPECQFYASPGALAEDPVMTAVDPQRGLVTIPRCDADCMQHWCKSSGQCGNLPICVPGRESPPCIHIDPDRLLKDYFQEARMRDYTNLRPNTVWGWGDGNVGGWPPPILLDNSAAKPSDWVLGRYRPGEGVSAFISRNATGLGRSAAEMAMTATKYLFSCPGAQP